jgi:hypothetical protein
MKYRLPTYLLLLVGIFALLSGPVLVFACQEKNVHKIVEHLGATDEQRSSIYVSVRRTAERGARVTMGCGLAVIVLASISIYQMREIQRAWGPEEKK